MIGKIRAIIKGYLLPKNPNERLLEREEFMTMLLHAARIVNSTPLWETDDSPNEPQPISPQMLLTQRDDACKQTDTVPTRYSVDDIREYGTHRWKRVEALAELFWQQWQHYMFEIGTTRPKWKIPKRNAQVGDVVLIQDKDLPRLQWSTGTITFIKEEDSEGLVRRVVVKPHKRKDKPTTEAPRIRAIHDLILIKAITEGEETEPDSTDKTEEDEELQQCVALLTKANIANID